LWGFCIAVGGAVGGVRGNRVLNILLVENADPSLHSG